MNNPEEAIERVFVGLREAKTPAGMEARIVQALEARAAEMEARGDWRRWMLSGRSRGFRLAFALAGTVVLLALVASMRKTSSVARDGQSVGATVGLARLAGGKETVPQRLKPRAGGEIYGTPEAVPYRAAAQSRIRPEDWVIGALTEAGLHAAGLEAAGRSEAGMKVTMPEAAGIEAMGGSVRGVAGVREESGVGQTMDYDSLALSEMLAPSRPAPPLPITYQERLLAEVVHHDDSEALTNLRPDVRDAQFEIGKAEVHAFFEPPPAKDNE